MTEKEQKSAAKAFAAYWKDKGDEKSDTQSFWLSLLHDVYGVEEPTKYDSFEKRVKDTTTNFIDVYIPSTRVMIEQKMIGKNLRKGIIQSDGSILSPFQQAKRYIVNLPVNEVRHKLVELFRILDTKENDRDWYTRFSLSKKRSGHL